MSYLIGKHQCGEGGGGGDIRNYTNPIPLSTKIKVNDHGYEKHSTQFWYILLQFSWNQMLNFNTYNYNYEKRPIYITMVFIFFEKFK